MDTRRLGYGYLETLVVRHPHTATTEVADFLSEMKLVFSSLREWKRCVYTEHFIVQCLVIVVMRISLSSIIITAAEREQREDSGYTLILKGTGIVDYSLLQKNCRNQILNSLHAIE